MYHAYVGRQLRKGFDRLCLDKYEAMLKQFPAGFELDFSGYPVDDRVNYNLNETLALYGKIFRAYPDLKFEVKDVTVAGGPWNTRAAVEWRCRTTGTGSLPFTNEGVHIFHIRWGRVVGLKIYCDTRKVLEAYQNYKQSNHRNNTEVSEVKAGKI